MVDTIKFSLKKTATGACPVLTFLMKVPADYQENYETYSTSHTKAVRTVGDTTAKLYTSAERTELSEYVGLLVNFNSTTTAANSRKRKTTYSNKVTRHLVSLILGDDSQTMCELSGKFS